MNIQSFLEKPWAQGSLHEEYANSFLHMRPAPEYASGEVLLASTYRQVGFAGKSVTESVVPKLGLDFQERIEKVDSENHNWFCQGMDAESWRGIVTGTLRSPKQPNQSTKRFLQISPVVPDASIYSLSARLSANSWNPGALAARTILFGEPSEADAQELWNQLFYALSVDKDDDIWARFLQGELETFRTDALADVWSQPSDLETNSAISQWHSSGADIPAHRFTEDLTRTLTLKGHLTRRQWTSIVESILRLGTASHILWLCQANSEIFKAARLVLQGKDKPSESELKASLGTNAGFWRYGQYASTTITSAATGFVKARVGLNLLLHHLEKQFGAERLSGALANIKSLSAFLAWLYEVKGAFDNAKFRNDYQSVIEFNHRIVAGKSGISSNIKEFLRHVLGQRQTAEVGLDSYDQGYFLKKTGTHKAARWQVSLGPVSVLAIVHACTHRSVIPRTVEDLCQHLGAYGIEIKPQEVPDSSLGHTLRNLGLVLDSPDAEGGMVIINPFEQVIDQAAGV